MSADIDPSDFSNAASPALDRAVNEAVGAGVVAATAVSAAGHGHGPLHTHCENCGTKLEGPFCHRCGQHDYPVHRSFRHAAHEALENLFHFEGKFFRNVITLLFRPGGLTDAFNRGHRVAQMPPFRLYLFVSVLFFVGFFSQHATVPAADWKIDAADINFDIRTGGGKAGNEAGGEAKPAGQTVDGERSEKAEHVAAQLLDPAQRQRIVTEFTHSLPKLLLIALPLFALFTRVLFRRSGQVYLQHLVTALHYHTFVYLWLMLSAGWSGLIAFVSPALGSFVDTLCTLWLIAYPVWMLRRLYGNGWRRTAAKTVALWLVYSLALGAIFLAGFILLLVLE